MMVRLAPCVTRPLSLLLPGLLLPCASCGWMGEPVRENPHLWVRVLVENHSFADVNVFVERDDQRFRLGTVHSKATKPFVLTHRMLGGATEYRLLADPIGSLEWVRSPTLPVFREATTHWRLEPSAWLSSVVFR